MNEDTDPDKKWITTWNDYLWRIKYFYRWFYNYKLAKQNGEEPENPSDWINPKFLEIKKRRPNALVLI